MDIADAVTTEFEQFEPSARISKLVSAFQRTGARALPVVEDGDVVGVVPRRSLLSSHHNPSETVASIQRDDVPRIQRTADVREVARLVVESDLDLLPVYEGERFDGVVTADSILRLVRPNLDALVVDDVATTDLVSVSPDATLGEVIHRLRERRISRLPVIEEGDPVGMVSIYDLVGFVTRSVERAQGGDVAGFDGHGGTGSGADFRTHGGRGERAGEQARLLDLPVSDVMSEPAQTVEPDEQLGDAVEEMLDEGHSSLVVVDDGERPLGIVTTTDALRSLTWTGEQVFDVQVFGIDLVDDLTREAIADRLREIDEKHSGMTVIEANVVFHEHKEALRGVPLLQCTVRLFTDDGRYAGTGEGYGAAAAFRTAAEISEENVLEEKSRRSERTRRPADGEEIERLLGWWIEA